MGSHGHGSAIQEPKSQSLARERSLHNLTLDEVQSILGDLGKPLRSICLDELLKSMWTVESSQAVVDSGGNDGGVAPQQQPAAVPLQREPSVNLSGDVSKKTVEEVWRDIEQKRSNGEDDNVGNDGQETFGEMTLEDFLSKTGVVTDSTSLGQTNMGSVLGAEPSQASVTGTNPSQASILGTNTSQASVLGTNLGQAPQQSAPQQSQWMQYQVPSVPQQHQHQPNMMPVFMQGHPVQQAVPIGPSQIMDVGYPESQVTMSQPAMMGRVFDTQTPGRKRVATTGGVLRNVEKKQKRMIKNRESAARSRARRQAYTQELENKVSKLEEENERLRKQRDMEKVLPYVPPPEPKCQLRRTSSSQF